MRRRDFMMLLGGGAAVTWPLDARAQQPSIPVIGLLSSGRQNRNSPALRAFRQGLSETGYVEDRNLAIEYRWAEERLRELPGLAAELIQRQVTVIVTLGGSALTIDAAKAATTTIPIVFTTGIDPVKAGLVASLNRPGGNITGVIFSRADLVPKRLELLHELVPTASIVGFLIHRNSPLAASLPRDWQSAAETLGLQIHLLYASRHEDPDFDAVFAALAQLRIRALMIANDPFFWGEKLEQLAALTLHHAVPAISQFRRFADAGGLMSYEGSFTDSFRQAGVYTGRILKGEKAADLPVQETTKGELIINLRTAKALGITVPSTLLAIADEVIE
jgi:putative ABC transport system substrate-binding protein